ncbi:MAG: DUF3987 domain-containing protein [Paludibacteraceae bacterium]|nr:DUF3987 domain-containing protein [Paludibacteraceae bacterium]
MLNSNNLSEGADTLITSHLRQGQLPWQIEKAISIAPKGEMRDMLLLSVLTNLAYAQPAMRMYHGFPHHVYGPELMTMVLAPAASGKGIMNYGKKLLQAIEDEHGELIYLPANSSSAALMSYLQMLKGRGIMMATEIDTLSKALGSTTGGFSDTLRCMFEHETISKLRKNQEELIEIPDPHFSVLISGTYNQLKPLIKSRENGLMSRFASYVVKQTQDFDDRVWLDAEEDAVPQEVVLYQQLSKEISQRYAWMKKAKHSCFFYLTDAQRKSITRMFRGMYETLRPAFGNEFDSILKRMPVIMKRIGMIITGLRLDMSQPLPERVVCAEDDFETMLLMGHKLLLHAAMMYQMLPNNKDAVPGEIGQSLIQKQFFQMLPADFTKQDAIKTAEVLGIASSSASNHTRSSKSCVCLTT